MHDPLVVAFEIRRPWPRRTSGPAPQRRWEFTPGGPFITLAGRRYYFPSLITVWHHEPGDHDAFEVCKASTHWRWHVRHWQLQFPPLQALRRRLLTTCAWCGGPDRPRDRVNCSTGWRYDRAPWWRGEAGLFHSDCSGMPAATRECTCIAPIFDRELAGSHHGECANCGRTRGWRWTHEQVERARHLQRLPFGARPPKAA